MAELAVQLTEQGHRVTVVTASWDARWPARITFRGVPVVRLPFAPRGGWETSRYARALARWLRDHRDHFELVYVLRLKHEAHAVMQTLHGGSTDRRLPVVLRPEAAGRHGDCLWQIDASGGRRVKRECLKAAAFVAADRVIERELQAAGYPRPRIHHLPDGVELPPPRSRTAKTEARFALAMANASLEVPHWAPLALCLGELHPGPSLRALVAAWQSIVARWPEARLWLAGGGPDRAALMQQIEVSGLSGRVVRVGPFDDIGTLLAAADLFVLPSLDGGVSRALLEAMAAGLPIVAGDTAGHRSVMADGRQGLLVPASDAEALAAAVVRLLERRELSAQLGTAARACVAEFSLAKTTDRHVTLFTDLRDRDPNSAGETPVAQDAP